MTAFLAPFLAKAAIQVGEPLTRTAVGGASKLDGDRILYLLMYLAGWFGGLVITLSVILILYAAFLYVTAAGDSEKVKQAHQTIIYAIVGIAVAIISWGIPNLVGYFLVD